MWFTYYELLYFDMNFKLLLSPSNGHSDIQVPYIIGIRLS